MKIKKKYRFIDIQIDDLGKYTDVSYLVDKTEFVDEIEKARIRFNLDFNYPLSDLEIEKLFDKYELITLAKDGKLKEQLNEETERIRLLFRMPPHFKEVIKVSIIYGKVYDGNYSKAYLEKQVITSFEDPDKIPDLKYCIVIHSGTRIDDVKKVFRQFQDSVRINYKATKEEQNKYNYGYYFDFSLTKPNEIREKIIKLQDYYRAWKNGTPPLLIALKKLNLSKNEYKDIRRKYKEEFSTLAEKDKDNIVDMIGIIEGERDKIKSLITRYRKFLSAPNTIL